MNDDRSRREPQPPPYPTPEPSSEGGTPSPPGPSRTRVFLWIVLSALLAYWLVGSLGSGGGERQRIDYTEFRRLLADGNVERVTTVGSVLEGRLRDEATATVAQDTVRYRDFVTRVPSFGDDTLLSDLRAEGVDVDARAEPSGNWWSILFGVLPLLLLLFIGLAVMRSVSARGRGLLEIGRSRARLYERRRERTTFDDVAGADGAKTELRELVDVLKDPGRFRALGAVVPKGVILVGPPGTGKTLLARAVAGEAEVPFFVISGSDFMEMFVGVGAKRVRDLFEQAKKAAPSIVFIDELDSIGRHRGAGLGGGHDEREQTLNQLLSELDGFEPSQNVIVMGATNRPDILDPALLRPGRFDRHIVVDLPSSAERHQILELHARDKPLADDVDLGVLARATPGFSGADLENLLNESAFTAARERHDEIRASDVEEARDRILMGLERRGLALSDRQVELLAYHEAGHTLVSCVLPHADPIHKVTIVPRGRSMGSTHQLPDDERYVVERDFVLDRLAVMVAGRAAERAVFDTATSGAEDDLVQATSLARRMVVNWGMSERLGSLAFRSQGAGQVFLGEEIARRPEYSESTGRVVDEETKALLDRAMERALGILRDHRSALDRIAASLVDDEMIPGERVEEILREESGTPA